MAHRKNQQKYKKHSKKHSKKDSKSTSHKSHHKKHQKKHCGCEQLFYAPLPNLAIRPPTQTVTTGEWFAPGSVQSCCSICSSVKPVYATPCTGYCCKQY